MSKANEVRVETKPSDFVPFSCHFNENTILTKNGELLQTIKIHGFSAENIREGGNKALSLKQEVRNSIKEAINSDDFAIWFHTVRRKKSLALIAEYPDAFSKHVHSSWNKKHNWENKYVNELYVTIMREGYPFALNNVNSFLKGFQPKRIVHESNAWLEKSFYELDEAVNKMLKKLSSLGAKRLGLFEKNGEFYSENLRFFSKIINLEEFNFPVKETAISDYLCLNKISMGFNALEVRQNEKRHFGAILSLKEFHEVKDNLMDEFLQLPFQFIITEALDFIPNEEELKGLEYQNYLLTLSGDQYFSEISGIDLINKNKTGKPNDFGNHQITIMIIEDSLKLIENEISKMQKALSNLGLLSVREDIMLEDCFWAQLPGNFAFLRRKTPINIDRIAGFASLYNFPAGKPADNKWGSAVTVFYSAAKTPYFFNFHMKGKGNTLIIGPEGSGKTVLTNFLVSESRKFNPRIIYLDYSHSSEIFIRAMGGKYFNFDSEESFGDKAKLNPFSLPEDEFNTQFLVNWLEFLLTYDEDLKPQARDRLEEVIRLMFSVPKEQRSLARMANILEEMGFDYLAKRLELWFGEGKYAAIFDNDDENIDFTPSNSIMGVDATYLLKEKLPLAATVFYLLQKIFIALDGKPTIIVLDEAWKLFSNTAFHGFFGDLVEEFSSRNAIIIFTSEDLEFAAKSKLTQKIVSNCQTEIYMPNQFPTEIFRRAFGLSFEELEQIAMLGKKKRHFLMKHDSDKIIAELNLADMKEIVSVLSAKPETLELMRKHISEKGDKVDKWLTAFIFQKKNEKS